MTFDVAAYINQFPKELLMNSQARKHLCRTRPMLFAILYLPHHISFDNKPISFSQFHLDLFDYMEELAELKPGRELTRDVWIAPRNSGKTTFVNLIIPLWLLAFEYESFLMSFSENESQAIMNLQTIKTELEGNELLRADFPEFCNPKKSRVTNRFEQQSQVMMTQANGAVMVAKGVDSNSLGSKAGHRRPGLVILDDVEGTEANYSENAAKSRLQTILNGVLPLNFKGKFILIGTTTRPDSIVDMARQVSEQHSQFKTQVKSQSDNTDPGQLSIGAVHDIANSGAPYAHDNATHLQTEALEPPALPNDPRSDSEALRNEWSRQESLLEHNDSHTTNDVKTSERESGESTTHNHLNQKSVALYEPEFEDYLDEHLRWVVQHQWKVNYYPAIVQDSQGLEHSLWSELWSLEYLQSIRHTRLYAMNYANKPVNLEAGYWNDEDIQIDSTESFDRVLLAVDPAVTTSKRADFSGFAVIGTSGNKIYVIHSEQIKSGPDGIRAKTNELVEAYGVQLVYLETNFGSELWRSVFDGLETKIRYYRTHEKKELRITRALDQYKRGKVFHCKTMNALEDQMRSYPKTAHEDILDAVAAGVNYFTAFSNKPKVKIRSYA